MKTLPITEVDKVRCQGWLHRPVLQKSSKNACVYRFLLRAVFSMLHSLVHFSHTELEAVTQPRRESNIARHLASFLPLLLETAYSGRRMARHAAARAVSASASRAMIE